MPIVKKTAKIRIRKYFLPHGFCMAGWPSSDWPVMFFLATIRNPLYGTYKISRCPRLHLLRRPPLDGWKLKVIFKLKYVMLSFCSFQFSD